VTKLSRLDASEDWKVVDWCRMQVSSHNLQGIIDGGVNKAGMSTAAPDRRAVLCVTKRPIDANIQRVYLLGFKELSFNILKTRT